MVHALKTAGLALGSEVKYADRLRSGGFQNVECRYFPCPLGTWVQGTREKRVGAMGLRNLLEGIDGVSTRLFALAGEAASLIWILPAPFRGKSGQAVLASAKHHRLP